LICNKPNARIHDILRKAAAEEDYKWILEAVSNGVDRKSIADCHPAAALRSEWDYLSVINGLVVHNCKRIVIPRGARDATLQVLHRSRAGVAIFTTSPPPPPPTREEEKKKTPPTTQKEGKKKIFGPPLPEGREKEEETEGQQPPTGNSDQVQAAAAPMELPKTLKGQFVFFKQNNNSHTFFIKQGKSTMLITVPSLIATSIATAVVMGGITGTAVYLTAGDTDVVTGDQIKTENRLHILKLGHMEPWAIAMMCATIFISMGTCGACCHKRRKSYVTAKEAKLRDRALGRAKELVHMGFILSQLVIELFSSCFKLLKVVL
jgi:hypothetical protein